MNFIYKLMYLIRIRGHPSLIDEEAFNMGMGLGDINLGNVINHSIPFHMSLFLITHHPLQLGSNSYINSEYSGSCLKCILSGMLIKKRFIKAFRC